jgi:DNA-directed RNA polymerase subunit K/omega
MGNLQLMVMKLFPQFRKPQAAAIVKMQEGARNRRKLLLRLAARAFELESGKPPLNVLDLVPKYLPIAPKDPDSGAPLRLQN